MVSSPGLKSWGTANAQPNFSGIKKRTAKLSWVSRRTVGKKKKTTLKNLLLFIYHDSTSYSHVTAFTSIGNMRWTYWWAPGQSDAVGINNFKKCGKQLQKSPVMCILKNHLKESQFCSRSFIFICVCLKAFRGRIEFCVFKDMIYWKHLDLKKIFALLKYLITPRNGGEGDQKPSYGIVRTVSWAIRKGIKTACVRGIYSKITWQIGNCGWESFESGRADRVYCRVVVSLCRSNYHHLPKAQAGLWAKKIQQRKGEKAVWEENPSSGLVTCWWLEQNWKQSESHLNFSRSVENAIAGTVPAERREQCSGRGLWHSVTRRADALLPDTLPASPPCCSSEQLFNQSSHGAMLSKCLQSTNVVRGPGRHPMQVRIWSSS